MSGASARGVRAPSTSTARRRRRGDMNGSAADAAAASGPRDRCAAAAGRRQQSSAGGAARRSQASGGSRLFEYALGSEVTGQNSRMQRISVRRYGTKTRRPPPHHHHGQRGDIAGDALRSGSVQELSAHPAHAQPPERCARRRRVDACDARRDRGVAVRSAAPTPRELLRQGTALDARDRAGATPLITAVETKHACVAALAPRAPTQLSPATAAAAPRLRAAAARHGGRARAPARGGGARGGGGVGGRRRGGGDEDQPRGGRAGADAARATSGAPLWSCSPRRTCRPRRCL